MESSFNDLYKQLRNRLRSFSRRSVISAALRTLGQAHPSRMEMVRSAPWQVLLIVTWALQDSMMTDIGRAPISQTEFDALRQSLWDFPERLNPPKIVSASAFARRLIFPQLQFQRGATIGFLREAALIGELPQAHPMQRMFHDRTGLLPTQFVDFAFATYPAVTVDQAREIDLGWFRAPRRAYGEEAFRSFLNIISKSYEELVPFARSLVKERYRHVSELFEFTPLARYPFLREAGRIRAWHPLVFLRGMEGLVHSILSEAGPAYIEPFSELFERHVVTLIADLRAEHLTETQLRQILGRGHKVTDRLVAFGNANVLIEVKAGIFRDSVMTTGDAAFFRTRTRALEGAIHQGWAVASGVREMDGVPKLVAQAPLDYLLVVTNWDVVIGSGLKLREMYPEDALTYPSALAEEHLPLSNVFFVSVDEFERLVEAVLKDGLDLPGFLRSCVERNSKPETSLEPISKSING